jgi:hypothetical protein
MNKIILVGFQGSGKNTVGDVLVADYGYTPISFADCLKDCVAAIFCWDRAALEGVTPESREWREQVDPWWAEKLNIPHLTPRWAMRNFGTDVMRQHFNTDVWITNVERRILNMGQDAKVVVLDGRFPNEIDLVTRMGGTSVRVKRGPEPDWFDEAMAVTTIRRSPFESKVVNPTAMELKRRVKALNAKAHESEWAWIGHPITRVINNDGTKEDLKDAVRDLMQ